MTSASPRRSAAKTILIAATLLITGAVVSVVVAWIPCFFERGGRPIAQPGPAPAWPHEVPEGWPPPRDRYNYSSPWTDCVAISAHTTVMGSPGGGGPFMMVEYRLGFPWRSLTYWATMEASSSSSNLLTSQLHGVWMLDGRFGLLYLPIWPGFALDTILYAAVAWGLWQTPLAIRRRRRRARGGPSAAATPSAVCRPAAPLPRVRRQRRAVTPTRGKFPPPRTPSSDPKGAAIGFAAGLTELAALSLLEDRY